MKIEDVKNSDDGNWLELAQKVEPLFGPMVGEAGFNEAIKTVIGKDRAFCLRDDNDKLCGIIVISYERNEIEWFAVANSDRRKGYGEKLLNHAINKLNPQRMISVQTFDKTVLAGLGARKLYIKCGFHEVEQAGLNPAGVPTVILKRTAGLSK